MKAGDSVAKVICLQVATGAAAGTPLSYADKTAFQAAGWDITWRDVDGVALTSQPTWSIAIDDATVGTHRLKSVVPAADGYVHLTVPAGYRSDPRAWSFEGQSYDDDSIAGLLQTAQGVPAVLSADDGTLGDVVEGDSWTSDVQTIPVGRLSRFGVAYADLVTGWVITAGFRTAPGVPANAVESGDDVATDIIAEFVAAASGTYKVGWVAFQSAMELGATEASKVWYMDVQLRRESDDLIITVARWALQVVWERDDSVAEVGP